MACDTVRREASARGLYRRVHGQREEAAVGPSSGNCHGARRSGGVGHLAWRWAAAVGVVISLFAACTADEQRPVAGELQVSGQSAAPTSPRSPTADSVSPVPGDLASFYDQRMSWRRCSDGFFCTEVRVPLDSTNVDGDAIELAMVRLPAGGERRLGSLVVSPGGPGFSAVSYARQARRAFSSALLDRYDVVGVDQRGRAERAGRVSVGCRARQVRGAGHLAGLRR